MQPNQWRERLSPAATGLRVVNQSVSDHHSTARPSGRPDVPTLLHHHAGYVEAVLCAICAGESISLAGRRALAFSIERIRHCAEVIR